MKDSNHSVYGIRRKVIMKKLLKVVLKVEKLFVSILQFVFYNGEHIIQCLSELQSTYHVILLTNILYFVM